MASRAKANQEPIESLMARVMAERAQERHWRKETTVRRRKFAHMADRARELENGGLSVAALASHTHGGSSSGKRTPSGGASSRGGSVHSVVPLSLVSAIPSSSPAQSAAAPSTISCGLRAKLRLPAVNRPQTRPVSITSTEVPSKVKPPLIGRKEEDAPIASKPQQHNRPWQQQFWSNKPTAPQTTSPTMPANEKQLQRIPDARSTTAPTTAKEEVRHSIRQSAKDFLRLEAEALRVTHEEEEEERVLKDDLWGNTPIKCHAGVSVGISNVSSNEPALTPDDEPKDGAKGNSGLPPRPATTNQQQNVSSVCEEGPSIVTGAAQKVKLPGIARPQQLGRTASAPNMLRPVNNKPAATKKSGSKTLLRPPTMPTKQHVPRAHAVPPLTDFEAKKVNSAPTTAEPTPRPSSTAVLGENIFIPGRQQPIGQAHQRKSVGFDLERNHGDVFMCKDGVQFSVLRTSVASTVRGSVGVSNDETDPSFADELREALKGMPRPPAMSLVGVGDCTDDGEPSFSEERKENVPEGIQDDGVEDEFQSTITVGLRAKDTSHQERDPSILPTGFSMEESRLMEALAAINKKEQAIHHRKHSSSSVGTGSHGNALGSRAPPSLLKPRDTNSVSSASADGCNYSSSYVPAFGCPEDKGNASDESVNPPMFPDKHIPKGTPFPRRKGPGTRNNSDLHVR